VNTVSGFRADHMPYGGFKHSGVGKAGIKYAMEVSRGRNWSASTPAPAPIVRRARSAPRSAGGTTGTVFHHLAECDRMSPVGIGLVGYGGRGAGVASRIDDAAATELVGVCDQDPDRLAGAEDDGIETVTDDYQELLALGDLEAVAVTTGVAGHAPLSIAALEAGKHVLCEKPSVSARASYSNFSPKEVIDLVTVRVDYTDGRHATLLGSMGGTGMHDYYQVVGASGNASIDAETDEVLVHDIALNDTVWDDPDAESRDDWSLSCADGTPDQHVDAFADRGQLTRLRRESPSAPRGNGPTERLLNAFAERIRGQERFGLPTFHDGFDALRIAKATVRSHERGETVYLDDVAPEIRAL
jgi:predicted dehydrogenase